MTMGGLAEGQHGAHEGAAGHQEVLGGPAGSWRCASLLSLRFSREALRRDVALSRPLPRGVTTVPKMSRRSVLTAASTRATAAPGTRCGKR